MYKNILQFIFGLMLIYSCGQNPAAKIMSVRTKEFLEMVDTISIEINADLLGKYARWAISEDNYLVAYNHWLHKIDIFDLEQKIFSHSIQLDKRGPNGISSVGHVIKIGDEYFIKGGYFYNRISKEGAIISKKAIKDFSPSQDGYIFFQKGVGIRNFYELSSDIMNFCIFQPIYKYQESGAIDFSSSFMCSIDVFHWTTNLIKVNFPELVVKSFPKTGFLGDASMLRNGHVLVFNFPGGNEVYAYDTISQYLTIHDPIILNRDEMKIDIRDYGNDNFYASANGQRLSPRYLGVRYNAHSNTYYRLHKTKGESISEANYSLIKMDSNFNTLIQYNLGDLFNPIFQMHDGYLYFAPRVVNEDALYNLKLYRIKG